MSDAATKLPIRVVRVQLGFSAVLAVSLSLGIPHLLLVDPVVEAPMTRRLFESLLLGGVAAAAFTWLRLRRFRYLLRALALEAGWMDPSEMAAISDEHAKIARAWLTPHALAVLFLASPWRPPTLDFRAGFSAAVLAAVVVAAAALPLHMLIRRLFLRAIELAPVEVTREMAERAEHKGRAQTRIPRRLLNAVATPVAFVALGAALIANAHLRRADEYSREETARALARASLELGPGLVEGAGIEEARQEARTLGFDPSVSKDTGRYSIERTEDGITLLTTPLDVGSAEVRFSGSTVPVLGTTALTITILAVLLAAFLGYALGRAHSDDLLNATARIRSLSTEAVITGRASDFRTPRFRVVQELEQAIEQLAERFRVFATAQERAIEAREGTTRMRGLFFASVSHDLKSPLNAILGFAELVRQEPLSSGQSESLGVIERRGRELLALIETILDAARVEAGQLSLIMEEVSVKELVDESIGIAKRLAGETSIQIVGEIGETMGTLVVDRVQLGRALATLIAYGVRQAEHKLVRVRALAVDEGNVRIDIEVPSRRITYRQLSRLLSSSSRPRLRDDRGLALGVGLSRTLIQLHNGTVRPVGRTAEVAAFSVTIPRKRVG